MVIKFELIFGDLKFWNKTRSDFESIYFDHCDFQISFEFETNAKIISNFVEEKNFKITILSRKPNPKNLKKNTVRPELTTTTE